MDLIQKGLEIIENQIKTIIKRMKNLLVLLVILLSFGFANSQKVYVVNNSAFADVKVYVVNSAIFADLLVYKVDNSAFVGKNDGEWLFVSNRAFADKKIYFVNNRAFADLKIFYVDSRIFAGWNNKDKMHLMEKSKP
ncbi:hypothetical protein SAMN03080601_03370 [Alkalitalea saponilacus]|uniref:7(1) septoil knot domain-containing protein n=1 Tax=Alkalitalea saponilacus TaxID=889453 RepID=A0A1T5HTR4_9BACT|nr:hypothetical protein SAMN03080601_03370 [Alkalitalea saponilacus]